MQIKCSFWRTRGGLASGRAALQSPRGPKTRTAHSGKCAVAFVIKYLAQSIRSSLKVRWPEIIVETMDWRDMMSSRIAA